MVTDARHLGRSGDGSSPTGAWDRDAFQRAYRDHSGAVYALARGLCAAEVAEDITHQVFLDLWHHPERDDRARPLLRAPLLAVAHALSLGATRSEASRPERGAHLGDAGHLQGLDDDRDPAERPLDLLPREEREAIVAVHHRGYTCAEAGVALGVDEATVKARIRQGLRRIGSALTPATPVAHGSDADLAVALDRRDVVAHAQGIIMEREGRAAGEAEDELVRSAEDRGLSLHAYAEVVVAAARPRQVTPAAEATASVTHPAPMESRSEAGNVSHRL